MIGLIALGIFISDSSRNSEYFSIHLLASEDLDRHTYTDLQEHTLWAEFHAYGAVIVCPSPSIIDYYPLIRLISYLRNLLWAQLAKTIHSVVCVYVFRLGIFVFMHAFYTVLCGFMCVCTSLWRHFHRQVYSSIIMG